LSAFIAATECFVVIHTGIMGLYVSHDLAIRLARDRYRGSKSSLKAAAIDGLILRKIPPVGCIDGGFGIA